MDLSFGGEYDQLREEIRAFLTVTWPLSMRRDADREAAIRFRKEAAARGYLYPAFPRRLGGGEQLPDPIRTQIVREEFDAFGAPREAPGNGATMLAPTLLEQGSSWQQDAFIPRALSGESLWCQGYSEPCAGSDLASLQTRAELRDGEWIITGQKVWTTLAHQADYMFLLARTEPDRPRHRGISYLLLDMRQPGVEVRPIRQITGTSEFNEVFLTEARTPADWIVGRRGEGWTVSRTTLKHERNTVGNAGRSVALFESLLRLARRTIRDGRPAIEDPIVRDRLVTIFALVQSQIYGGYYQMTRDIDGRDPGPIAVTNKLAATTISERVADLALDLLDCDALLAPTGAIPGERPGNERWMRQYLGSIGLSFGGGTSNIQRNIIAERGYGLPRGVVSQGGAP
jgi:alkylation response protein AidB-like acyl-CoA dehydrogenase